MFQDRPNQHGQIRSEAAANLAANRYCLIRLKDRDLLRRLPVILRSQQTGSLYQGMVNVLTKAGADLVADHYEYLGYGTPHWTRSLFDLANQQLAHAIAINDFLIHLQRACWQQDLVLADWWNDRELAKRKDLGFTSTPDAFVVIATPAGTTHGLFVEIDRGSETVLGVDARRHDWRRKVASYASYVAPGGSYWRLPFYEELAPTPLILTITTTPTRLEGMLKATQAGGGTDAFWYTTFPQLDIHRSPGTFWQPIWRNVGSTEPCSLHAHLHLVTP
ncbi:MAG: replication-relaxation family protein [Thermomicrobiales bacterium]